MGIICYTKMPLLYELYGEQLFSHFASIFPQRTKKVFGNYYISVMNSKWNASYNGNGLPFLKQLTLYGREIIQKIVLNAFIRYKRRII